MSEIDVLLHDVNKNREDGKVLFSTIVGVMSANLAEFITQPADGILYDLNRDEVTTASFGITTRTINDLAVATVIRYLRAEIARRDEIIKQQGEVSVIFQEQLSRRDEIIARLKEDAERLADGMIISPENEGDFCSYCGGMEHVDDCLITLHHTLMKELEND